MFNRKNPAAAFWDFVHHLYHDNRSGNWENYFCNQQQKKADRSKPNYEIRAWFQDPRRKTFSEEIMYFYFRYFLLKLYRK